MFVVLLKFSEKKSKASEFMDRHYQWIKRGFDDGFFVSGKFATRLGRLGYRSQCFCI